MKLNFCAASILCLALAMLSGTSMADDDYKQQAVGALGEFIKAWNTGDNAELRKTLNYPAFTLFGPGQLTVAQEPGDFTVPFDRMRKEEKWDHSTFEDYRALYVSPKQVHIACTYRRFNTAGRNYQTGGVFYIMTNNDGHWGMQLRSGMPPGPNDAQAERAARAVIDEFFTAWNNGDNAGTNEVMNFPHAFIIRGGRAAIAPDASGQTTDFDAMRKRENWHHSAYHDLKIVYARSDKVLAYLTFTRHHPDGEKYTTVPVLWVITNQNGHWGIQVRAIPGAIGN